MWFRKEPFQPSIKPTVISSEPQQPPGTQGEKRERGSLAKRRRNARQKALQALYQWDFDQNAASIEEIVAQFCELQNMEWVDVDFFAQLATHVTEHLQVIDQSIVDHADREIAELDPVERAILRVAGAELRCRIDIPYKVIVNEAVEIAKAFGADQGHKYVNGVVDKMAADIRSVEYGSKDASD